MLHLFIYSVYIYIYSFASGNFSYLKIEVTSKVANKLIKQLQMTHKLTKVIQKLIPPYQLHLGCKEGMLFVTTVVFENLI